jgi:hypothetical protein
VLFSATIVFSAISVNPEDGCRLVVAQVVWYKFTNVAEVLVAHIIPFLMKEAASTSEMSVNFHQTK